jgi:hypothetical protein
MRGDPPAELDYLLAYYRGVYFATIALKGRLAKLGPECQPAVRAVGAYQAMVKGYWDALKETAAMHPGRESGSQG